MFIHEREALKDVMKALRSHLHGKIVSAHAFGSRVRGSHDESSDFDLLVVVDGRTTALEQEVIGIIVEEEMKFFHPSATVLDVSMTNKKPQHICTVTLVS